MKNLIATFLAPDSRAAKIVTSVFLFLPLLVEVLQTLTTAQLLDPDTNRALLTVAAALKLVSNFTSKKTPPVREKSKGSGSSRNYSK